MDCGSDAGRFERSGTDEGSRARHDRRDRQRCADRLVVPGDAALVRAVPGTRADLVPGEYVFIGAQAAADGVLSAARVQVSKDGVRSPQ